MHTNIYVHAHEHTYTHTQTHVDALYSCCITGYCQGINFSQIGLIQHSWNVHWSRALYI